MVDGVNVPYYMLVHRCLPIFPAIAFWSRVPSGPAAGDTVTGVVLLGRQFSYRTVAVAAGAICAILPRST